MVLKKLTDLLEDLQNRGECTDFRSSTVTRIPFDRDKDLFIGYLMDGKEYQIVLKSAEQGTMELINWEWECIIKCDDEIVFQYKIDLELLNGQSYPRKNFIRKIEELIDSFIQSLEEEEVPVAKVHGE